MNETIKTYKRVTVKEAAKLELSCTNGLAFRDRSHHDWFIEDEGLLGLSPKNKIPFVVYELSSLNRESIAVGYEQCAKVTEFDPCKAPDGCPELEPWMAYVGKEQISNKAMGSDCVKHCYIECDFICDGWYSGFGSRTHCPKAIDVRTAWAQEHFPEHCRIRNYQEPDPFNVWYLGQFGERRPMATFNYLREAYELGQVNFNK